MARRASADAGRIVDAAVALADQVGWPRVRLFEVARRLKLPLPAILTHYRDLDAVADAWLRRGETAMLAAREKPGFDRLDPPERLYRVIVAFLDALAVHRRVTAEIFRAKLYVGHPHHNLALLFWLSRTVQWVREAALLRNDAGGRALGDVRRRIEETGLTALFVATLWVWASDRSPRQQRTRAFLKARLMRADRAMARLFPRAT